MFFNYSRYKKRSPAIDSAFEAFSWNKSISLASIEVPAGRYVNLLQRNFGLHYHHNNADVGD